MACRTRWIVIGLIGFVILTGCVQTPPSNENKEPTSNETGMKSPDEISGTPESGTARLGDIQLRNKNNTSSTVIIQVSQNNSTIYQKSISIPPKTETGRGPIYLDGPNVSGSFVVEARLKGHSEWNQIRSTRDGLHNGGCFAVSVIVRQNGQLDVFPAGRSCEGPP